MVSGAWTRWTHMAGALPALLATLAFPVFLQSQELDVGLVFDKKKVAPVRELLQAGDYGNVAKLCALFIERGQPSPDWWIMRLEAASVIGDVDAIVDTAESGLKRHKDDLQVLVACHEALTAYGKSELAAKVLQQFNVAAKAKPASQRTPFD